MPTKNLEKIIVNSQSSDEATSTKSEEGGDEETSVIKIIVGNKQRK